MKALFARAKSAITGDAPAPERSLLVVALSAIYLKDLLLVDVPRDLLERPGEERLPWIPGMPQIAMDPERDLGAFAILVALLSCALLAGYGRLGRLPLVPLLFVYVVRFLSDQCEYSNNVFLLMVLTAFTLVEPVSDEKAVPRWPTTAVRILVACIYVVGAMVKLGPHWTSGHILEQALKTYHFVYPKVFGDDAPRVFRFLAITSIFVEAFLAFGLFFRRTRKYAFATGILFHAFIDILLPVRVFSYVMSASYLCFFEEDELPAAIERLKNASGLARVFLVLLVGLGIDFTLALFLQIAAIPARNAVGLFFAVGTVVAFVLLFDERLRRTARPQAPSLPRVVRAPLFASLFALEIFAITKPLFGYTNRFGWRMFTEVYSFEATASAREGDVWEPLLAPKWRGPLNRWDSAGEQRAQVIAFAKKTLRQRPTLSVIRLELKYTRNGTFREETVEVTR